MKRVLATPKLIDWACKRSRIDRDYLEAKFKNLPEWISGKLRPTEKQLEQFAKTVHVPYGYLFLNKPPKENIPSLPFRTKSGIKIAKPNSALLNLIYAVQVRQEWYKEFAISEDLSECALVNCATIESSPADQAQEIRKILRYDFKNNAKEINKSKPFKYLIDAIEDQGILVMIGGIGGSNIMHKLNAEEFRGYALCDEIAPLILVNGINSESVKMFTLIHELGHLLLGSSDIFKSGQKLNNQIEDWCNTFAAEFLVPTKDLQDQLIEIENIEESLALNAKYFKVCKLTILERLRDINIVTRDEFDKQWNAEIELQMHNNVKSQKGGNFLSNSLSRVGKKFAFALIVSALEGQTLYRDAYRMLGISKTDTFEKLAKAVGAN